MSALREVRRDVRVAAPASRVWAAIADPQRLAAWLGVDLDVDVREGAEGTARDGDRRLRVAVDRVEPPQRLVFRWWEADGAAVPSQVEISVGPDGNGTTVAVRETAVPDLVEAG